MPATDGMTHILGEKQTEKLGELVEEAGVKARSRPELEKRAGFERERERWESKKQEVGTDMFVS